MLPHSVVSLCKVFHLAIALSRRVFITATSLVATLLTTNRRRPPHFPGSKILTTAELDNQLHEMVAGNEASLGHAFMVRGQGEASTLGSLILHTDGGYNTANTTGTSNEIAMSWATIGQRAPNHAACATPIHSPSLVRYRRCAGTPLGCSVVDYANTDFALGGAYPTTEEVDENIALGGAFIKSTDGHIALGGAHTRESTSHTTCQTLSTGLVTVNDGATEVCIGAPVGPTKIQSHFFTGTARIPLICLGSSSVKHFVVPLERQEAVIRDNHNSIFAGHMSAEYTLVRIQDLSVGHPLPVPTRPGVCVSIDYVGPLPVVMKKGKRYILVMIDQFSGDVELKATKSADAKTAARNVPPMLIRRGLHASVASATNRYAACLAMQKGVVRVDPDFVVVFCSANPRSANPYSSHIEKFARHPPTAPQPICTYMHLEKRDLNLPH
ncbi:hypothetical protein Pelo_379 [Pelomyxa schiedti]|nr:hypothetical protein Pelo_379 [Pelomyxa schiedti]